MSLINLLNNDWAIIPEWIQGIKQILESHISGGKLDLKELENRALSISGDVKGNGPMYDVIDGTAVIQMFGVMSKRPSIFERVFYNGVSTEYTKMDFLAALEDSGVERIILHIDSPGGTVDGTQALAEVVKQNRGKKPVIAFSDGVLASAAYWVASAADEIYISGDTVQVGSIGVVATHTDYSKMDEEIGIKVTEIYAGKYKRIISQNKPLTEEGKEYIQDRVNYLYSVFVDSVADNRGVDPQIIADTQARIYMGKQAIEAGLVDGVSTLDGLLNISGGDPGLNYMEENMNVDQLKTEHSDVYDAVYKAGAESVSVDSAVEAERERIKSVHEQLMPGYEDIVAEAMFDGKSTGGDVATKILAAEKSKLAQANKDFNADGVDPLAQPEPEDAKTKKDFMTLVNEEMEAHGVSFGTAIGEIASKHPDLHKEYVESVNKGDK